MSSYKVQYKDSLWGIAKKKYNNPFLWREIAKLNGLKDPNQLLVGQVLFLPDRMTLRGPQAFIEKAPRKFLSKQPAHHEATLLPSRAYFFLLADEINFFTKKIVRKVVEPIDLANNSELFAKIMNPEKHGFSPIDPTSNVSLGRHVLGRTDSKYISASKRYLGSPIRKGKRYWIDVEKVKKAGGKIYDAKHIESDLDRIAAKSKNNPKFLSYIEDIRKKSTIEDREIVTDTSIPAGAVKSALSQGLTHNLQFLEGIGIIFTIYDLEQATKESYQQKSPVPLEKEAVVQTGGWGGAFAGARLGALVGGAFGTESGPGALITGAIGSVIFGTAGYFDAKWVSKYIHKSKPEKKHSKAVAIAKATSTTPEGYIVPSPALAKAMNRAESLMQTGNIASNQIPGGPNLLLYIQLDKITKDLTPHEKKMLSNYIAKRSVGVPIEQSMRSIGIATKCIKFVGEMVGKGVHFLVIKPTKAFVSYYFVEPSKFFYRHSDTVSGATDWVVEHAENTADWVKEHTPGVVTSTWTGLMKVIHKGKAYVKKASDTYHKKATNFSKSLHKNYLVNEKLANQTLNDDIPFLSEQLVILLGTKGVGKAIEKMGIIAKGVEASKKRTGAFTEGLEGSGLGLGKLTYKELKVSPKGLNIVKEHIREVHKRWGIDRSNEAMIQRLEQALEQKRTISGADASFYIHELREATTLKRLMREGMDFETAQNIAHAEALNRYKVSPYSVYHPEVIETFAEDFNNAWKNFWNEPGLNFTSKSDATNFSLNNSGGKYGTPITTRKLFEEVLGPISDNAMRLEISREQAILLAKRLGIPEKSVLEGGVLSIIDRLPERGPRPLQGGNSQFRGVGKGLPQGDMELSIHPIQNAGGGSVKKIDISVKISEQERKRLIKNRLLKK